MSEEITISDTVATEQSEPVVTVANEVTVSVFSVDTLTADSSDTVLPSPEDTVVRDADTVVDSEEASTSHEEKMCNEEGIEENGVEEANEKREGNEEKSTVEEKGKEEEERNKHREEIREARKERRVMSGMAAFLSMMKGDESRSTVEEEEKEKTIEQVDLSKLNRKERRALLKERGDLVQHVEEKKKEHEVRLAIRPKVTLDTVSISSPFFVESTVFQTTLPKNGFQPVVQGNNYIRSCKFSTSGSLLATSSQDRHLRIFNFDDSEKKLSLKSEVSLGGLVYDMEWHPREDWIATTSRDHPIHLWNGHGLREASFRGINHLDELSSAVSLRFSLDGSLLYAGYNKFIRVFDLNRPGRQMREIKTWSRDQGGQRAILSCIAVNPIFSGVFAVGCYSNSIGLYSDRSKSADCLFSIPFSALSQLEYSNDGLRLYASTRNAGSIACFDLRNPGQVLYSFEREGYTNQKFTFDLDRSDHYLFSGSSTGDLLVFDVRNGETKAIERRKVSSSALVGLSLHPSLPVVATCSGERIYREMELSDDEEGEEERKRRRVEGEGERGYREGKRGMDNAVHLSSLL